ncbi:MAG: VCBS repeat-containing protein [Deltaproteobacteria bacterium]|nr:MAG: VCBS repeat-containing protein [Deltaproteobacteria bacterium]
MLCNRTGWLKVPLLLWVVLVLSALPAVAGFEAEVARDLGPKVATLVAPAPTAGEWLIDADAAQGVQTGDLFAVVLKGAPIVHPVTKQTLGNLETVKAVLRVTKVKSGYSYALPVGSADDLKAGEVARRFSGLPATFWDYTGKGEGVLATLQGALPDLHWQSYSAAQAGRPDQGAKPAAVLEPGLVFVLNAQGLAVKDHTLQPLRFYRPEQFGMAPTVATAAAPAPGPGGLGFIVPQQPVAAQPQPAPTAPAIIAPASQATAMPGRASGGPQSVRGGLIYNTQFENRDGVWYGPRQEGHPIGLEVGDMDGDGKKEVAVAFKDRLEVSRIDAGNLRPVARYDFPVSRKALSLDGLDLNGDGRMELYLSSVQMLEVRSLLVELRDGQLLAVNQDIPWFTRSVILPGEGRVLLGQELDPQSNGKFGEFAGPLFRLSRAGDTVQKGATIAIPKGVELFGFSFLENNGQSLLASLTIDDKLKLVDPTGRTLWESSENFGGSETAFERQLQDAGAMNRFAFLKARLEPLPDGTVLVPVNEGIRATSLFRQFRNSHLRAVGFDGYSMVEKWRTRPQGGYLADFRVADADNDGADEIVMVVMFSHGGMFDGGYGNSAVLVYELQ